MSNRYTMASLRRNIKEQKKSEEAKQPASESVEVDETPEFKHLWFISDAALDKNIKEQLAQHYSAVRPWDSRSFANRSPRRMLEDFGVQHMWTDIRNTDALEYVRQYVKKNTSYTTVLVHRSNHNMKHQKWISQLESIPGAIDVKLKTDQLSKMASLTLAGLIEQIEDSVVINSPASLAGAITGFGKGLKKKAAR